jgi:hypothetical protein
MTEVLRDCHAVLVGQTPELVPADRLLYAMRDHTGTVESPFLICASIMSKKLAEDLNGLVLDVKVGSGAFMPTYERSRYLAELMVSTGEASGTRTAALLTSMDEPLGRFSGNWIEVWECVDILQGKRHAMSADLIALSNVLSGWMLYLARRSASPEAGALLADELMLSGAAYKSWLRIVAAQGGDTGIFTEPAAFHKPKATRVLAAQRDGYLSGMDCKQVGWAVQRLGAGRSRPGDAVSAHAGIESHAKIGDKLAAGHLHSLQRGRGPARRTVSDVDGHSRSRRSQADTSSDGPRSHHEGASLDRRRARPSSPACTGLRSFPSPTLCLHRETPDGGRCGFHRLRPSRLRPQVPLFLQPAQADRQDGTSVEAHCP